MKLNAKKSLKNKMVTYDRPSTELYQFITDKNVYLQEIIRNTIISIRYNNQREIFSNNDTILAISLLTDAYHKTIEISKKLKTSSIQKDFDTLIEHLQVVIDKLSMIICGFGTKKIEDLLFICFGTDYKDINIEDPILREKYNLIKTHITPIGYKIIKWKQTKKQTSITPTTLCSNKIVDEIQNIEDATLLECFDTELTNNKTLFQKIYELRLCIPNETLRKTIIIYGIVEDIQIELFTNKYVEKRREDILQKSLQLTVDEKEVVHKLLSTMNIKDILIYGNDDVYKKMMAVFTEVNNIKRTNLETAIKKFVDLEPYSQRNMIVNLLLYSKDEEIQYICYILYELITVNILETTDHNEQKQIYDSLPQNIKKCFKDIIKNSMKTMNDNMQKYEKKTISFEQQIHLLKSNDIVKEKATIKLKEIKGKSEETCIKAKQYLEGLLKIPFGIYREEPILKKLKDFNKSFGIISANMSKLFSTIHIPVKTNYTTVEIVKYIKEMEKHINDNVLSTIKLKLDNKNTKELNQFIKHINNNIKDKKDNKIVIGKQKPLKQTQIEKITEYLQGNDAGGDADGDADVAADGDAVGGDIGDAVSAAQIDIYDILQKEETSTLSLTKLVSDMTVLKTNIKTIEPAIDNMYNVLDESIYGHSYAKDQIMKIITQWMSGEQTGYCFGFEGSPGIGKTSLAKKGLANCLKNNDSETRPFAFIALGGSCNGSFLEGHGYTYINSSWGRITDILIQTKCMNPIIYIDELDKVSKTENGKEIIGILTHIIDQTQNDIFQDKYFSGIDIDLSKVLFIFSYNDAQQIDKVLLDRIHRIKFDNLSLNDKITIVKKYILPEINSKMGFDNVIEIKDEIIEYIIETYTAESGVRKLKELLFDLYGEVNLDILRNSTKNIFDLPISISKDNLENKYLKKYTKIQEKKIHAKPEIGIINGLWANSLGIGGIVPIQTLYFPSSTFLELKLTGLQGEVMKESMNVAKTLAWNLTPHDVKMQLVEEFDKTKCQGIHIHCPEGAISKDGPSAGAAITCALFSLFNKKNIRNDIAMTGEINLQGEVTAIGGLDIKIMGGIIAGITTFIYPKTNNKDFMEWQEKNKKNTENINFVEVSTITEVFQYVFN